VLTSQHSADNTTGAVALSKFNFSGTSSSTVFTSHVVDEWVPNSDAAISPILAVDSNPATFTDPAEMLRTGDVEAVHITTPPQSHFALAQLCLEAGCHVYLEKPFTVNAVEADELIDAAAARGRHITVGHNLQFSPEAMRLRKLVHDGVLGGPPVHLECVQCYSHDDPTYGRAVLADPTHWVRRLPGTLLHNLVSHGVAKIAEFLDGDSPELLSITFSSPYLVQHNQRDIVDEVRAVLRDNRGTTAFFLFTTQCAAASNELRLFGKACNVTLDNTYRTVLRTAPSRHKSYLRYFLAPQAHAAENSRNTLVNMRQFARKEFQMDFGMRKLMELFYCAVRNEAPDPIPLSEIRRTARIMDAMFDQCRPCPPGGHRRATAPDSVTGGPVDASSASPSPDAGDADGAQRC
jgi:predicted dehydrogenase